MDVSWWGQMSALEHVYWIIAIAGPVVLLVQLVLAFASAIDLHMGIDMTAHYSGDYR